MPTKDDVPTLQQIQAWLHTFVVEPGTVDSALRAAEKKSGFPEGSPENLVLPSPTLTPLERIQIYRRMYLLRMQEALEIDFPAVRWYVGKPTFTTWIQNYVIEFPSQSYTLDHLGRSFATFLASQNWSGQETILMELAQLEWAMCEVAIACDSPTLTMADLASVAEDRFLDLTFEPIPALRMLHCQHNVNRLYSNWANDQLPTRPNPEPTNVVVWRHSLKVWRLELTPTQHIFLDGLLQGKTLADCLDQALATSEATEESLFECLQQWLSDGLFSSFLVQTNSPK